MFATPDPILNNYPEAVSDVDLLFAPHHGRDSGRSYDFLDMLKPKITLFGNASSKHLADDCYPPIRITNNQAGYIVIDISEDSMAFYVKNYDFEILDITEIGLIRLLITNLWHIICFNLMLRSFAFCLCRTKQFSLLNSLNYHPIQTNGLNLES